MLKWFNDLNEFRLSYTERGNLNYLGTVLNHGSVNLIL
jgi:hypothetical protein